VNQTLEQTKSAPAQPKADFALAFIALVWGATFVVVKGALTEISTLYFLALRFTLGSLCMLPMLIPVFRQEQHSTIWRGLRGGFITGAILWLGYTLQTFGLQYTTAGNSGFITSLYIVFVPMISAALYRRWPRAQELAGVAITGTGMVLLTLPSLHHNFHFNFGDLLTLGCAVSFAFHMLVLGYFSQRERFEAVALGQIACVALLSFAGLPWDPPRAHWSSGLVFAIVLTGLFATALAFIVQTWAQQYTSATRAALLFALEPVFALATAVFIGGEKTTGSALLGCGLILAGILTVELKRPSEHKAA
jgi:drug/metabolite transporter (DMT)-like permease